MYSSGAAQGCACSMTSSQSTSEAACAKGKIDSGVPQSRELAGQAAAAAGVTGGGAAEPLGLADAAMAGFTTGVELMAVESTDDMSARYLGQQVFSFSINRQTLDGPVDSGVGLVRPSRLRGARRRLQRTIPLGAVEGSTVDVICRSLLIKPELLCAVPCAVQEAAEREM